MDEDAKATLLDIVDTPISPELIPADENGEIKQKTEDLVGPYELHDFSSITSCVLVSVLPRFTIWLI